MYLFSEGLDCMDWQKDSCGPRGICLRDPYLNHLRDCKCFPGHYYLAHIAACVGKDKINDCLLRQTLRGGVERRSRK